MRFLRKKSGKGEEEQDANYPEVNGRHYLEIIAGIEKHIKPELYLEIGSRSGTSLAPRKCAFVAVDPVFDLRSGKFATSKDMFFFQKTSDAFFESEFLQINGFRPDLAFVDGLHLFENALRDFMNCEKAMSRDGYICIHDVVPFNGEMTTRDESYLKVGSAWTGDVWKVVLALNKYRPDLQIDVLNSRRTGLCCVTHLDPTNEVLAVNYDKIVAEFIEWSLIEDGPGLYFDKIELEDADRFLARLGVD